MKIKQASTIGASFVALSLAAGCGGGALSSTRDASVQGLSKDKIEIGTVMPLSGGASLAAQGLLAGVQASIGQINAKGGVNGRKVNLTVLDDHFDAATHVSDFKRLVSDTKVFAVLAPAGSANVAGDWPIAKESGIPVFGPYLPADPGLPSVFTLGTSHMNQARVIVTYLSKQGAKRIAFIGQQDPLGESILAGLKTEAGKLGVTVGDAQWIQPNSSAVGSAVLNAKAQRPDAVILGTDNAQSTLILKQAAQLKWRPTFAGDSSTVGANSSVTTKAAGDAATGLLGSYVSADPNSDDPAVVAFRDAVGKFVDHGSDYTTNSFALQGYAYGQIFLHLLQGLGATPSWSGFIHAAESTTNYTTGLLPTVTFGQLPKGHVGTSGAKIAKFDGTKWVSLTPDWLQPE